MDKDFIGLTQFPKYKVACIIIRLKDQAPRNIVNYLDQLLKNQEKETLEKFNIPHLEIISSSCNSPDIIK